MKINSLILCTITLLVLLCAIAVAEQPTLRLSDFSGGLNTKDGIFQVKPNQATICTNFDLGVTPGALTKRKGYEDVGYFDPAGTSPTTGLVSLYAHYYRDGRKELFGIGYATGTDPALGPQIRWGRLYRSGNQRLILDTAIFNYCYTGARWHWVSWKDLVIAGNGRQSPIVWNGNTARSLVIPPPGAPSVVPMDTVGHLNGVYTYMLIWWPDTSLYPELKAPYANFYFSGRGAHRTAQVAAYNEKVLLYNFPELQQDSIWKGDTAVFRIARTKYVGGSTYGQDTGFYFVVPDTFRIPYEALDTFTYIDTTADANLTSGDYYDKWNASPKGLFDVGTSRNQMSYAYGMPHYLGTLNAPAAKSGRLIYKHLMGGRAPDGDTVLVIGTAYMMTYFDSLATIESDSGRVLYIQRATDDSTKCYNLAIPPVPPADSGLFRILYKAFVYKHEGRFVVRDRRGGYRREGRGGLLYFKPKSTDTLMTDFFPIKVFGTTDTNYVDSFVVWDSLILNDPYERAIPPDNLTNLAYFRDALWGSVGGRVYWSYFDSIGYWGAFSNATFDLDDGDEITAIVPDREFINIFKNKTQYVLYEDSDGKLTRKSTDAGRGCVAPFSIGWYNGSLIYLDETGVFAQSGNIYKDKGSTRQALSDPIANQIDFPIRDLKNAVGFVHRDQYWLSFPEKDSTFVFDFKTGGWSAYTYAFDAAVHYDTVSNNGLVPSNDMLFCRKAHTLYVTADSLIYKADTTYLDNGSAITGQWQSQPLLLSNEYVSLDGIGFWRGADADTGRVIVTVYNSAGASAATDTVNMYNQTFPRYGILGINTTNQNNYLQIRLRTSGIDSLVLHGLDIYGKINGAVEIR